MTNGVLVNLEAYTGLGNGPVILGPGGVNIEIANSGNATTGVNSDIDIVDSATNLIDGTGTYAAVFFGNFYGSSTATLTFEPASGINPLGSSPGTNRMRFYGTNTVCNAKIFIDGPSTPQAQYSGDEIAFYNGSGTQTYNGAISGNGGLIMRGNGTAILNSSQSIFSGGTTPTAGVLGLGASSVGTPGSVTSGPLGTGLLLLAPEAPGITATGQIISSGGSNNVGNTIEYPSGTNNLTLEIGGTNNLTLSGPFSLNGADGLVTNTITSRNIQVTNTGLTTLAGAITDGGKNLGFNITGPGGTLALNGADSYGGATSVSGATLLVNGTLTTSSITVATNSTLGGSGSIHSPVTIQAGGNLAAGNQGIGTLILNNTLTLSSGSTNIAYVNGSGANSKVTGVTTIAYAGTLAPVVTAGTITNGQTFTLFSAGSESGSFTATNGTPGPNMAWSFNPANGVLTAVSTSTIIVPNIPPKITGFSLVGSNVSISGTNGVNGGTYYLLGQSNVALPINQWFPVATNVVTTSGSTAAFSFTGTNLFAPTNSGLYLILSSTNN